MLASHHHNPAISWRAGSTQDEVSGAWKIVTSPVYKYAETGLEVRTARATPSIQRSHEIGLSGHLLIRNLSSFMYLGAKKRIVTVEDWFLALRSENKKVIR